MRLRSEAQRLLLRQMDDHGLKHADVAGKVGLARPTVTNILNGKRLPDIESAAAFESAYGIAARLWAQKPKGGERKAA